MVRYSQRFKQSTMAWLNLRPENIEAAIKMPDQVDPFELFAGQPPKPKVVLYMKNVTATKRPSYMLVLADEDQAGLTVLDAWLVPQDWVREDPRPKQVLEALCTECGYPVKVGPRVATLIISEDFPVDPESTEGADFYAVLNVPLGGEFEGQAMFMVDDQSTCHVAVAYALDRARLQTRLRR